MKKLYWYILLGICITLGAYSVLAGNAVRGVGIYSLGNTAGWILSVTRHYTGAAAVILLVILIVKLIVVLMKRKDHCDDAGDALAEDSGTVPVRKPNGKIQPAAPQQDTTLKPQPDAEQKAGAEPMTETKLMPQSEDESESQPSSPKFCVHCGEKLTAETKFCTKCGTPVNK